MILDVITYILLILPTFYGASLTTNFLLKKFSNFNYFLISQGVGLFVCASIAYAAFLSGSYLIASIFLWLCLMRGLVSLWLHRKILIMYFVENIRFLSIVSLLSIALAFPVLLNGLSTSNGMWFFGASGHDGLWHASLMETLLSGSMAINPTFSGEALVGYHLLPDLLGAILVNAFNIDSLTLVYQLFPLHFSWLIIALFFSLAMMLYQSSRLSWLVVLFSIFGGNFGYILNIFGISNSAWESMFWSQQGISSMINLPFAFSLVAILVSLLVFTEAKMRKELDYSLIYFAFLLGTYVIGIKVYGGVLLSAGYGVWTLHRFTKDRILSRFIISLIILLLGLVYIAPSLSVANSAFVLSPGWFVRSMMISPDRVNFPQWESLRINYQSSIIASVVIWFIGLLIFIIGNFGTKILGILGLIRSLGRKSNNNTLLVLSVIIFSGLILPLVIIQRGTSWNSIQFMYYSLMFSALGIPAIIAGKKSKKYTLLFVSLFIFSLPSTAQTLFLTSKNYTNKTSARLIDLQEIEALKKLKSLPEGQTLSPYNETAYIPALSGKGVYYSDSTQAEIFSLETESRRVDLRRVFIECMSESQILNIMSENKLRYIYYPFKEYPDCINQFEQYNSIKTVFANNSINILEIQ